MEENRTTIIWIVIGVIAAVAVIALIIFVRGAPAAINNFGGETNTTGEVTAGTPKIVLPGISQIEGGEVITESGKIAKNDAVPGSADAPKQSLVTSETNIPLSAIKISASLKGFSPSTFEVRSGVIVTLAVTSDDGSSYLFAFEAPELSAVTVGIGPGQTRVMNFKAPAAGTYDFRSAIPGHAAKGLVGKMIVK